MGRSQMALGYGYGVVEFTKVWWLEDQRMDMGEVFILMVIITLECGCLVVIMAEERRLKRMVR